MTDNKIDQQLRRVAEAIVETTPPLPPLSGPRPRRTRGVPVPAAAWGFLGAIVLGGVALILLPRIASGPSTLTPYGDRAETTTTAPPEATYAERYGRVELFKQDCMVEQDFQYFPDLPSLTTDDPGSSQVLLDVAPSDEQWAASDRELLTFGYGYFINREEVVAVDGADPNSAYLASLSDSDRAAYSRALAGCSQAAEDQFPYPPVIEGLGDLELEIDARINEDPRLIASQQAWSDCVAAAGFTIPDGDPFLYLEQRFKLVTGLDHKGSDLNALPPATLEQLQQEELALAAADVACQQPVREVYREVAAQVTAQVLAENPQIAEQLADFGE